MELLDLGLFAAGFAFIASIISIILALGRFKEAKAYPDANIEQKERRKPENANLRDIRIGKPRI